MNYRLKQEAVPFFKEKYAKAIYIFDVWDKIGVDIVALEKVEECFISYGHESNKGSSLAGWEDGKGSRFHFTLNFPSMKFKEHDKFSNGKVIREMMNQVQSQLDYLYTSFNTVDE